jgi:hypothetical protein
MTKTQVEVARRRAAPDQRSSSLAAPRPAALELQSSACHTGGMREDTRATRLRVLSGLAGLLMMNSAPPPASGESISPPRVVAGKISSDQTGGTRPLTPSEVATISDWLAEHHSGWTINVATSPAGTVYISLDTASQQAAFTLILWSGPKYLGWNRAVLVEYPAQKTIRSSRSATANWRPSLGSLLGKPRATPRPGRSMTAVGPRPSPDGYDASTSRDA